MTQRKKIFVLGTTDNDLTGYACQQLERKSFENLEIICYVIPPTAHSDALKVTPCGDINKVDKDFLQQHYDIFISVGFKAIQLLPTLPSYGEIVFWDIDSASEAYGAITKDINYFISKYLYQ